MKQKNDEQKAFKYLKAFAKQFPGSNIELRIPEVGAIQLGSGSKHKRGIPPNVVEINKDIFIQLIEKETSWDKQMQLGNIEASGINSNIKNLFEKFNFKPKS
ncbi:MAG: sterol carrier family protein [Bifidobacteriaceae bacterium]|jgi:hypothetical protein|nr:sterol carrier family protein [Bifidobacteriaceae bacterium]